METLCVKSTLAILIGVGNKLGLLTLMTGL